MGREYERDKENCVVIRKPATPGYEDAEPIVLLNHMDMVCVAAEGVTYDAQHDTIKAVVEDGWMHANGTSLGADNGIGLSMALAVLQDDSIIHGPLEVLTTTNEEDGMTGAENLSGDFIKGRKVINLDSEDYDTITVGAAGATILSITMPATKTQAPEGMTCYEVTLTGGLGGHSGVDINKGRANLIIMLARLLSQLDSVSEEWQCALFEGGNAAASIPSSAKAVIMIETAKAKACKDAIRDCFKKEVKPYAKTDGGIRLSISQTMTPRLIVKKELIHNLLEAILKAPAGVIEMRTDMPDTVMTSSNIGVVRQDESDFEILTHSRSFDNKRTAQISGASGMTFEEYGGEPRVIMEAPSWDEKSEDYVNLVSETFKDVLGFEPRKVAMHFVLEAGYYVQKYPGIEIACIGPRIVEPHSTSERVEIKTVEDIWEVTKELLRRLAEKK